MVCIEVEQLLKSGFEDPVASAANVQSLNLSCGGQSLCMQAVISSKGASMGWHCDNCLCPISRK